MQAQAIVLGTAVNQDGRSSSLTAPNGPSQQSLLAACWNSAGVGPQSVGMVAVHGTGTPLGDPIEVGALAGALGRRLGAAPLLLGSVKVSYQLTSN